MISDLTKRLWQSSWHFLPPMIFLLALPLNHNMALRMLTLFLSGALAIRHAINNPFPEIPVKLPLALWAGVSVLSLSWSVDPLFSLSELKTELAYGMVAFFSFYILTQNSQEWQRWLQAIVAGMMLTVTMLIWTNHNHLASFQAYDWHWQHGFVAYSTYLVTILPCLIYFWLAKSGGHIYKLRWALLPLFLFAGYATLNRMFWLTTSLVFIVWIGLWWARRERDRHTKALLAITISGVLTLTLLFIAVAGQRPSDNTAPQAATSSISDHLRNTFEHSERYDIWRFWLTHIADKPLTGVGFGRDLPHLTYADNKPQDWPDLMFAHAHNILLDFTMQLGLVGLAAFLFLLGALLRYFWRLYRNPVEEVALIGICGMTTVIAMLSKNMTDNLFWRGDALLFWALMGILLGYGRHLEEVQR